MLDNGLSKSERSRSRFDPVKEYGTSTLSANGFSKSFQKIAKDQ
jgi:hypothetical protein